MEYIFTTDVIPEIGRGVSWQNEFLRVMETNVRVDQAEQLPVQGRIHTRSLGQATLVNVQLDHHDTRPHLLRHDPASPSGRPRRGLYVLAKLAGQSRYHYDGGSKRASPGDVVLFDGGQSWVAESPRGKHQTLVLKLDRESTLPRLGVPELPAVTILRAEQKLGGLVESYLRCLAKVDTRLARQQGDRLTSHFCELLALALQANRHDRPQAQVKVRATQLAAVREFMEQHLGDPTLSPESVAARFGVSMRYLHKLHSECGQSFSRWLMQRRLERCRHALDHPAMARRSIAEIALDGGFNDLSHFGRCFRAAYGLPPREWRRYTPTGAAGGRPAPGPKAARARAAAAEGLKSAATTGRKRRSPSGWLEPGEADAIRAQFARVATQGETFAADFYQRFFVLAPAARELFAGDLAGQRAKLMRMIALLVTRADAPDALAEPLAQLGTRHVGYGVKGADYAPMCEALMDTLAAHLLGEFSPESRHSWMRLFERVIGLMHPPAATRVA